MRPGATVNHKSAVLAVGCLLRRLHVLPKVTSCPSLYQQLVIHDCNRDQGDGRRIVCRCRLFSGAQRLHRSKTKPEPRTYIHVCLA